MIRLPERPRLFLFVFVLLRAALATAIAAVVAAEASPQPRPDRTVAARYVITPDPEGRSLKIEARMELQEGTAVLKDFGRLKSIRWTIDGKDVDVRAERKQDAVIFGPWPGTGTARIIYELACVTDPGPESRKRLMGGRNFMLAREGLFLIPAGRERDLVEVRWDLPEGWKPALGTPGTLPYPETQQTIWAAGRLHSLVEETFGGSAFTIAVLDDTAPLSALPSVEALKAAFRYAWATFGPLEGRTFGVVIFRRGGLGGGTAFFHTLAAEESPSIAVHEMLHWWTNFTTPAWFREGVHTYMATRLMEKMGVISAEDLRSALEGFLREHEQVVKREGRISTLAESSAAYDRQAGGGDMYGLMPLLASKLDREIRAANPHAGLEQVFAAVASERTRNFDLPALIKSLTGYDPGPLFAKYFYAKVDDPAELLKSP
jgi:predicted metalloprotease with PDZ domain